MKYFITFLLLFNVFIFLAKIPDTFERPKQFSFHSWYHQAVVRTGKSFEMYRNGFQQLAFREAPETGEYTIDFLVGTSFACVWYRGYWAGWDYQPGNYVCTEKVKNDLGVITSENFSIDSSSDEVRVRNLESQKQR